MNENRIVALAYEANVAAVWQGAFKANDEWHARQRALADDEAARHAAERADRVGWLVAVWNGQALAAALDNLAFAA